VDFVNVSSKKDYVIIIHVYKKFFFHKTRFNVLKRFLKFITSMILFT